MSKIVQTFSYSQTAGSNFLADRHCLQTVIFGLCWLSLIQNQIGQITENSCNHQGFSIALLCLKQCALIFLFRRIPVTMLLACVSPGFP